MMRRRALLAHAAAWPLLGALASLHGLRSVHAADYKALLVVFLAGGHDGNNMLIPVDGLYSSYEKARPTLAFPKSALTALPGRHIDHQFALSPALQPLSSLFEQKRMAIVANVGALVEPLTVAGVRDGKGKVPPFLGSHSDQQQWVQGWLGDEDQSGWGGRAMDRMPAELKTFHPLITTSSDYTAVLGQATPLAVATNSNSNWGYVNLLASDERARVLDWMSRLQSSNALEAEFTRTLRTRQLDAVEFALSQDKPAPASALFPDTYLGRNMRFALNHMLYSRNKGARRQIYLVQDGGYDTHTGQDATGDPPGLEKLFDGVTKNLLAMDKASRDSGLDGQLLTVVISEFGRTLDLAAGQGSDHAWGNHWLAMGAGVRGGQVFGSAFPSMVVGGPDDVSPPFRPRGEWLPQFSTDQFMADALLWLGLPASELLTAMPNLQNFSKRGIGFI
ncbi:MAG: hypothetical protein RLZZ395_1421 [Pseudomonadota bacterium]